MTGHLDLGEHWDVGAAALIALPFVIGRLKRVRLRNAFLVTCMAYATGFALLFGKRRA